MRTDLSWILDLHWPEGNPRVGEDSILGWTPTPGWWFGYVPDMQPPAEAVAAAMMGD